jgi:hypothetical protein
VNRRDPTGLADREYCEHMAQNDIAWCLDQCQQQEDSEGICSTISEIFGANETFAECTQRCVSENAGEYEHCRDGYDYDKFFEDQKERKEDWQGGPCYGWQCYASY